MAHRSPSHAAKTNYSSTDDTRPSGNVTNYSQAQADEVAVLQAIYMDDFMALNLKHTWNRTTDREFQIRLRAFSDQEGTNVVLKVKLTATYPRTAPGLDVSDLRSFHARTQERIQNIVQLRPRQLLGDVMIHAVCDEIQEVLEDAVTSRLQGALPSLEDERASAAEIATSLARAAEEAEARQMKEADDEADRILQRMVDEEVNRREKRKPNKTSSGVVRPLESATDMLSFDQAVEIYTDKGVETFTEVLVLGLLSEDKSHNTSMFLAKPCNTLAHPPFVVIQRRRIKKDRTLLIALEALLDIAQKLRHASIMKIYTYRIIKIDDAFSELIICQETGERNTLHEILAVGDVHISKAKQWTLEILEGLDFLHRNGMVHGLLNAKSVVLIGTPSLSSKLIDFGYKAHLQNDDTEIPTKWRASDRGNTLALQCKADIWNMGIIMTQMFLGLRVTLDYPSPLSLFSSRDLSEPFRDLLQKAFAPDTRKRPSAFELLPAEFLRTDSTILRQASAQPFQHQHRRTSSDFGRHLVSYQTRHNLSTALEVTSRYVNDFTELGRLGKGGFGEVVKARNKLDGGVYAVKKIRQATQLLDQVISEVMLLNRLNHPYVVRYFSTWVENSAPDVNQEQTVSSLDETHSDGSRFDLGYRSASGLDFVSSGGMHGYSPGDDSDSDIEHDESQASDSDIFERTGEEDEVDDALMAEGSNLRPSKSRPDNWRLPSTLYIQMEYCERRTLRDLIQKGMEAENSWRYLRQITEGLAHIHSHGIIHRDLKPDNVFLDVALLPKIGDFGLATIGQYQAVDRRTGSASTSVDMTRSVGTALYTAPELHSTSGSSYNDKVDIYSLGIMFFEMNMSFSTAMERIIELQSIRESSAGLPSVFQPTGEKAAQGKLINCLISHKPSDRPSSTELLRSEILPLKIEDETIRQALTGLSDPRSPYYQKLMSALFAYDTTRSQHVKALAWTVKAPAIPEDRDRIRIKGVIRSSLEAVFRRHGAEESRRDNIFPRSVIYTSSNVMQMLDAAGNLLQLPYDLTLPHALQLARLTPSVKRTYAFGCAYRDAFSGGPPRANEEADFDIIDFARDDSKALDDAEALKVLDEVILELPVLGSFGSISINVNHTKILDAILEQCRVPHAQRHMVREEFSKLGFHQWSWPNIRPELKSLGLSDTTLDDLQLFDFRELPDRAFARLQDLLEKADSRTRTDWNEGREHLTQVLGYLKMFGSSLKMFVAPLSCFNAKFYEGGMLFQCVMERKKSRIALAAGGRYDNLIQQHRTSDSRQERLGAVGICIGIEPVVSQIVKHSGKRTTAPPIQSLVGMAHFAKRCDVLVVVGTADRALQAAGIRLISSLWSHDISAELSSGLVVEQDYSLVVTLRHAASNSVRVTHTESDDKDVDVPVTSLINFLQQELRDRASNKSRAPLLRTLSNPYHDGRASQKNSVHVLLARHGSKKSNKYHLVETAQQRWAEKLDAIKQSAPILAVETRDEVMEMIQQTTLGEPESWRKAVQSVQLSERQYVQQVQGILEGWRKQWREGDGIREACVFNFRTGKSVYYDLGM